MYFRIQKCTKIYIYNKSIYLNILTLTFSAFSNVLLETSVLNLVSLTRPSLQILGKTHVGISDFQISGQSHIKGNCHNSRTSDDTDMKLGPETKLDKKNKTTKKIDNNVMSGNCDITVIFPIYGQFGAIRSNTTHSLQNLHLH